MSSGGVSFLLFLGISLLFFLAILLLARRRGKGWTQRHKAGDGEMATPGVGEAPRRLPFRPYLVLAVAVVFQAVLVILFAWAEIFPLPLQEGRSLLEPLFFVGIVFVGLVYVWRKGGFSWD